MPQNTSYNTTERIIRHAFQDCGKVADGDDPLSEQFADGLNRLNDMIGMETTQGLKLWTNQDTALPLVAGQATYTIGVGGNLNMARPMRVANNEAYYLDTSSIRRPLIALSRDEYTRLSQVTQLGATNSYFFDKQQTLAKVSLWLTPDTQAATGVAHFIFQIPITYSSSLLDTLNFPQEWFMWLRWALADELSTGQPASVIARCQQKAEMYRKMLEDWDTEEESTSFAPDQRSQYAQGSFR